MSEPRSCDAIVIGAGPSGLVAASYLGRAGKKVLLLEAEDKLGGVCAAPHPSGGNSPLMLYALDPFVVRDLKLSKRGLHFAGRELALTGLREDGKHIVISRDVHDTAASIALHSRRDADTWPRFRKELFELARAMRPLWWEARGAWPGGIEGQELHAIARMGAGSWLNSWFESELLKATLCFDSVAGGLSVLEPGSAFSLIWRAAQEISGLQGAVLLAQGGSAALGEALINSAQEAGCEFRTVTRIERIILEGDRVAGVRTQSGETCFAPLVFSAVRSFQTFSQLLPPDALGIASSEAPRRNSPVAEAGIVLTLRSAPRVTGDAMSPAKRCIIAEKPETYAVAEMAARAGALPDELPIEFVTMAGAASAAPGEHVMRILARPVPRNPVGGWPALAPVLAARVVKSIERFSPGISGDIVRIVTMNPDREERESAVSVPHMLATAEGRVRTPIKGLFFCGAGAEPVPALSGRAARIAVASALAVHS